MGLYPQYLYLSKTKYFHYYYSDYEYYHAAFLQVNSSTLLYLFIYIICLKLSKTEFLVGFIFWKHFRFVGGGKNLVLEFMTCIYLNVLRLHPLDLRVSWNGELPY